MKLIHTPITLLAISFAAAGALLAQTPPVTKITIPAKLIVSTAFDQDTPPVRKKPIHGWSAAIGQWQVKDGVLHGDEVKEDNHPSSCTWKLDATNMIISAQFRIGTAAHVAFGCRDSIPPNHHLARTYISKDAIWIVRQSGIAKTSKSEKLAELKTPIDPNTWHNITIEISGDHYRASRGQPRRRGASRALQGRQGPRGVDHKRPGRAVQEHRDLARPTPIPIHNRPAMKHLPALILCVLGVALSAAERPNILMIAVDDLRPQLKCYGVEHVHSPNMDRLAAQGVLFNRAYCMVPTCGASRASLMTSIRPAPKRFVTHLAYAEKEAPGITTLNTHLKQNGYHTISNGKVFHHPDDSAIGWSEPAWRPGQAAPGAPATPQKSGGKGKRQSQGGRSLLARRIPAVNRADDLTRSPTSRTTSTATARWR